jgi:hypothetical protein
MSDFWTSLQQVSFLKTVWVFLFVFVLHELEEWNINQFEHRNFVGLPPRATDRSVRMWIGFISLIGLIWCMVATIPGNPTLAAWIILPMIAVLLLNAIQHLYWTYCFRQYAPGVFTAVLMLVPLGCYMLVKAAELKYVSMWYVVLWVLFVLAGLVQTMLASNKVTPVIRSANNVGIWLSDMIR